MFDKQDNCAVHGFAQAAYDVGEGDRLDTDFRLNVKGMTAFPGLNPFHAMAIF